MIRVLEGDARERLAELPDASVQCVVTSPPYFGLRDYGVPGQFGLEPTLAAYITTMVGVFRDVWRVLRDDGTLWLNIGDSYASTGGVHESGSYDGEVGRAMSGVVRQRLGFKQKDLMMVPARLAIALQDDGWYLRSDIIWHKPNPMPESVQDRPTSAHEHIFLLTKSRKYFYDADAIRTEGISRLESGYAPPGQSPHTGAVTENGKHKTDKQRGHGRRHDGFNDRWDSLGQDEQMAGGANARNVWTIATKGFRGAHFAVFPPELPERCIRAGSKQGDTILDPFLGSGTTLLVADRLGRDGIGIELNPTYAAMARRRISSDCPLFADVA